MRSLSLLLPFLLATSACGSSSNGDGRNDMGPRADTGEPIVPDLGLPDAGQDDMGARPDMGETGDVVTQAIGAEGGTLEAEGVRLVVPAGALAETVEISLRLLPPDEIPDPERITGPAVDLGPDGQVFIMPVELVIDDPGPAPAGFRKAVLRLNEVTMTWAPVAEGMRADDQSIGRLSSFSVYAGGLVPTGGGNLMEGDFGCNVDGDCAGDLRCGIDYGEKFVFAGMDGNVCVQPHCVNGVRDELEAGVDCCGTDACGTCRNFYTAGGIRGAVRYGSFPVGGTGSPLVDLTPDAEGGVFALFQNGFLVQLDEDGNLLREEFFIDPQTTVEPFKFVELDQNNDIFLVDDRTAYKFDDTGSIDWSVSITGAPVEIRDMDFDCDNNLLLVGYYGGAAAVGGTPMLPALGTVAGFVVKIAPDGSVLHAQGFRDLQLEHVVAKTFGEPFVATCDYYVAGHSDGALTINFTGDPADDIPGSSGTAAAHAPFARFGPNDELEYGYRIAGSPNYSFDGQRVIMGLTIEDFNPVLFGTGSVVLGGGRGVTSGRLWGGRMNRNTGGISNFFDIGAGAGRGTEIVLPFEALGSPFVVTGVVSREETIGFAPNEFQVGQAGAISSFLWSGAGWVQTFDFTPDSGAVDALVMTVTTKARPVVGLSLRQNQSVDWANGTFDASTEPGGLATFIASFEP